MNERAPRADRRSPGRKSRPTGEPRAAKKPQPSRKPRHDRKPQANRKPGSGGEPRPDRGPRPGGKPRPADKPRADRKPDAGGKPRADRKPEAGGKPRADRKPEAGGKPRADRKPEVEVMERRPRPGTRPDADRKPGAGGKPHADRKLDAGGKPRADRRPEAGGKPRADRKLDADRKPQTDRRPEADRKPRPGAKVGREEEGRRGKSGPPGGVPERAGRPQASAQAQPSARPVTERKIEKYDRSRPMRSGAIALIGRANVGKSTLLNAALGTPLAITSHTPQTTRDTLLGVLHRGNTELRLLDTPGLHKPKSELGRVMNHFAREAARAADVVVFVTDVPRARKKGAPLLPHPGDLILLQSFKEGAAESGTTDRPVVLALNKVDLSRDKKALLPLMEAFANVLPFAAIVPLSALREGQAERLLEVVSMLCPEGRWQFGADDLTDRPTRYFAAEYVREQILRATRLEVPHAAAVTIDRFVEPERGAVEIEVTIHVERPGQKKILVGRGGETMKKIGMNARLRVEELLGRKVILKTWVRVTPAWRSSAEQLAELGYQKKPREEGVMIFAELDVDALDVDGGGGDGADATVSEDEGEAASDEEPASGDAGALDDDDGADEEQEQ